MKKCPFCAEEVQDEAIKCKHCGGDLGNKNKKKQLTQKEITQAISSLIVIGIIIWIFTGSKSQEAQLPPDNRPASETYVTENSIMLRTYCEMNVSKKLQSPSTAEMKSEDPIYNSGAVPEVSISGYVDSQNGFGAMIRSNYECKMIWIEDKQDYQMTSVDVK